MLADGPYILPTRDTFVQWGDDVKDAGGVVTVIPSGANRGAYAARFPAQAGLPSSSYSYSLAPLAVLAWQFGQMTEEQYTLALADFQDFIRELGSTPIENLGDIVGGAAKSVVFSFWWVILLGVGGLYLYAHRKEILRE